MGLDFYLISGIREETMGLDMFLYARRFVWHNEEELEAQLRQAIGPSPGKVKVVVCEAAYWRKANQIHKWFVDHVQKGKDDCGTYYVEHKQLADLLQVCQDVLAEPATAKAKLPTQQGFFFGRVAYDNDYRQDLELTVKQLTPLLAEEWKGWEFEYHASW